MTVSNASVQFYWRVVDHFRAHAGPWRMNFAEWLIQAPLQAGRRALELRLAIQAEVNVGSGEFRVVSRVGAKGGASLAFSRAAARDLGGLWKVFAKRGYKLHNPIAYYPLYGWRVPRPTGRGPERRFLAELAERDPGDVARPVRTMDECLASMRGRSSGDWRPYLASWTRKPKVAVGGRPASAHIMFHIAPADLEHTRLGVSSSITIWPAWSGQGRMPAWLTNAKRSIDGQFRAAGHRADWVRLNGGPGFLITSHKELRGLPALVRERRLLENLTLGDSGL